MTSGATNQMAGAGAMWGLADYPGLADRLAPAAALLADLVQPGDPRVLDLAAGTGNVAMRAARRGAAVTAADLSPRMVELGRARTAGLDVGWQVADAGDLPFENAAFDAVLSAFGIIFAPVPAAALAQARRVLASGGRTPPPTARQRTRSGPGRTPCSPRSRHSPARRASPCASMPSTSW